MVDDSVTVLVVVEGTAVVEDSSVVTLVCGASWANSCSSGG